MADRIRRADRAVQGTPLSPDRCAPGGVSGPDAMDWALRAAMALLGVSALWLLVVLLRPLSHGRSPEPATIPTIAEIANHPASIDERQARLAALTEAEAVVALVILEFALVMVSGASTARPGSMVEMIAVGRSVRMLVTLNFAAARAPT